MMTMKENSYGIVKRLEFIEKAIAEYKPVKILDIGCGTGEILTVPLAKKFPALKFVGADDDLASIEFARNRNIEVENLTFLFLDELDQSAKFEMIIASEVIEHVEKPGEFLQMLKGYLTTDGKIIMTLPNGYGPFEATSFFEALLFLSGINAPAIYRFFTKKAETNLDKNDTEVKYSLAVSPHINFFSYREIRSLITGNGLDLIEYLPRTFLCGMGFDQIIKGRILNGWNCKIAEILPPQLNSGWMFIVKNSEINEPEKKVEYQRNRYANLRKKINRKRWGLSN
jgi:2-polyprenyl-3-methyl-5-hydroxy-6-metoxy-1,4-benzoquinol methylase